MRNANHRFVKSEEGENKTQKVEKCSYFNLMFHSITACSEDEDVIFWRTCLARCVKPGPVCDDFTGLLLFRRVEIKSRLVASHLALSEEEISFHLSCLQRRAAAFKRDRPAYAVGFLFYIWITPKNPRVDHTLHKKETSLLEI